MRTRKNGGVIGPKNLIAANNKSGVWTQDDIHYINNTSYVDVNSQTFNDPQIWTQGSDTDPYYKSVIVHVPESGVSDHILKDRSGNAFDEVTQITNYYQNATPTYNGPAYDYWSTQFGDNAWFAVRDATTITAFGISPFTIEMWIKPMDNNSLQVYIAGRGGQAGVTSGTGWVCGLNTLYRPFFYDAVANTTITSGTALSRDVWTHVVWARDTTSTNGFRIYVNGSSTAGTVASNFNDSANPLRIGTDRTASATGNYTTNKFHGRLADIRITNTSVYGGASSITVPTAPLNMTIPGVLYRQSTKYPNFSNNTGVLPTDMAAVSAIDYQNTNYVSRVNDSPFAATLTSTPTSKGYACAAGYFGSSPMGTIWSNRNPLSNGWNFGTNPFTVEAWVYISGAGEYLGICGKGTGNGEAAGSTGWTFSFWDRWIRWDDAATAIIGRSTTNSGIDQYYEDMVIANGWYHFAAVRSSTATNGFRLYVNGKQVVTATVSTNYNDTQPVYLLTTRNIQTASNLAVCGLRVSNNARYTSNFDTTGAFINTSLTADANTVYLSCMQDGTPPLPQSVTEIQAYAGANPNYRPITYVRRSTQGGWQGGHGLTSRSGWSVNTEGGQNCWTAMEVTAGDFNFSTGDFSVELFIKSLYPWQSVNYPIIILDSRRYWNDTGFAIRYSGVDNKVDVVTNDTPVLMDATGSLRAEQWNHICLSRVGNFVALYINGRKVDECETRRFTSNTVQTAQYTINTPVNANTYRTISIMNGSYPSNNYYYGFYGYLSNLRINKGTSAYVLNSRNPETIPVPTSTLTVSAATVLLLFSGPILRDESGRNNAVWLGRPYDAGGNGVSGQMAAVGPFLPAPYTHVPGTMDEFSDSSSTGNNQTWTSDTPFRADDQRFEFSWITRLATNWTIEAFIYTPHSYSSSPINWTYFYNANAATHEGFNLSWGVASGAAAWNSFQFAWYTNNTVQYLNSGAATISSPAKFHGWNHVAIVYDATSATKFAMFVNGSRVATSNSLSPGTRWSNTYVLQGSSPALSGFRISNTARYSTTSTTCSIPTSYPYDTFTVMCTRPEGPSISISKNTTMASYAPTSSFRFKKWPNTTGSVKLDNTGDLYPYGVRYTYEGMYWESWTSNFRQSDWTVEMWVNWFDAAAGGTAIPAESCLWVLGNYVRLIQSGGYWRLQTASGSPATVYQQVFTNVLVKMASANQWDHVVIQRRDQNIGLYVNGVYFGCVLMSYYGSYTAGQGPTSDWSLDVYGTGGTFYTGTDWYGNTATRWTGHIQDYRVTRDARYETRNINGVATMVHRKTNIPALPTGPFPKQ